MKWCFCLNFIFFSVSSYMIAKTRINKEFLICAANNDIEGLKAALSDGANLNVKSNDEDRMNTLHYAAENGDVSMILFLLEQGINIESKDARNWTALMHAAVYNKYDAFSVLLEKGADLEYICVDEGYGGVYKSTYTISDRLKE